MKIEYVLFEVLADGSVIEPTGMITRVSFDAGNFTDKDVKNALFPSFEGLTGRSFFIAPVYTVE